MTKNQLEEKSIEEILDVLQKISVGNLTARILISNKENLLDAVAAGINMLGEEIQAQTIKKDEQAEALLNMLEDINVAKEVAVRTKDALKESEEKFRLIAETSYDLIFQIDIQGDITYCSPAIERILGQKYEDFLGTKFKDHFSQSELPKVSDVFQKVLNGESINIIELELLDKNGISVPMELNIVPIVKNGEVMGMQGIARDITERKKAQEELHCKGIAIESASDAIGMADVTGKSIYHNRAFIELFGYTPSELNSAGGPVVVYKNPEITQDVFKKIGSGEPWSGEIEMKTRYGAELVIFLRANAVLDDKGELIGLVGIHTDITERKRAEENLKKTVSDLERFNRIAVDRELQMIELKHEVNNLLGSMGREKKYKISASENIENKDSG